MKNFSFSEKRGIDKSNIRARWRIKLHEIIFEADTPAGRGFDSLLILFILLSVLTVMLDSVAEYRTKFGPYLNWLEWLFTILFTIEFVARLISIGKPLRYVFSFFGLVDFFSILPTYVSLILPGSQFLLVIRALRLIRIFRIFKLTRYLSEGEILISALRASKYKVTVFLGTVATLVIIMGTVMYIVEGETNGFTSIPRSIYWSIVTLTTVGYGDIAPKTVLGQAIASIIMIMGYG
ncbi:MAG TPA: ion transporter, partial [Spirochaetota bacterium]|nr:ion transporter [Spirochaetota bacterium]